MDIIINNRYKVESDKHQYKLKVKKEKSKEYNVEGYYNNLTELIIKLDNLGINGKILRDFKELRGIKNYYKGEIIKNLKNRKDKDIYLNNKYRIVLGKKQYMLQKFTGGYRKDGRELKDVLGYYDGVEYLIKSYMEMELRNIKGNNIKDIQIIMNSIFKNINSNINSNIKKGNNNIS